MSREVRKVDAGWEHPKENGEYIPLRMEEMPQKEPSLFQMYETTTEGTPISPAFPNIEELARWLADTGASALGKETATYDQWLAMCKEGSCISAFIGDGKIISGVAAASRYTK